MAGCAAVRVGSGSCHCVSGTLDGLGLESVGVFGGDWSGLSGVAAVETIRNGQEPTAIIAANDLVATGVLRAATKRGWDVPGN